MLPPAFSHYRVGRRLGSGGMGEVWQAEDIRLHRQVAIKVLPAELTRHPDRLRRFEQEARTASALNHPNIITVFDVGDVDGCRFLVTELVEGRTLRDALSTGRPGVTEAVGLALQVADALAAAHGAGIIHRDIKPENVMIRGDGLVKVLDFGLAKLVEPDSEPPGPSAATVERMQTQPGAVVGTVRYMSPEQARGAGLTAATDVFSLGIVLYELLAGRRPFEGDSNADVLASILRTDPPALAALAPAVPAELQQIVERALAKNPAERHSSGAEIAADLRRLHRRLTTDDAGAPATTEVATKTSPAIAVRHPRPAHLAVAAAAFLLLLAAAGAVFLGRPARDRIGSLAVLPFANTGNDQDTEYLSDGITESLINNLAGLPGLKVMSRNSVWRYRKTAADPREIGRQLQVGAVLLGRVTRRDGRLVVSAELVDTADNSQIWGERFDREVSEMLTVEQEIARRIAESLRVELTGEDRDRVARRHPESSAAYDRYLRGRYHLNKRSAESIRKGRDFFQQAIEEDPLYALAYSGISDSYALLAAQAAMPPSEAYAAALSAARKAVDLDPGLGEAHASLAHAAFHTGDLVTAVRAFDRAAKLAPHYVSAHSWRAEMEMVAGRQEEAFALTRRALQLDPLDLATNAQLALLLERAGRHAEAAAQARRTLEIDPTYFYAHSILAEALLSLGRPEEAIAEYRETARLTGGLRGLGGLGVACVKAGRTAEARETAAQMEARSRLHYTDALEVAGIYAALRDRDRTLDWVERALRQNPEHVRVFLRDEGYAFLRQDPRFLMLTGSRGAGTAGPQR